MATLRRLRATDFAGDSGRAGRIFFGTIVTSVHEEHSLVQQM